MCWHIMCTDINSICYQVETVSNTESNSNSQEDDSEPEDSEDEHYASLYQQSSGGGMLVWKYHVCTNLFSFFYKYVYGFLPK